MTNPSIYDTITPSTDRQTELSFIELGLQFNKTKERQKGKIKEMILKYLSEVPSYEKISGEEFSIREEMEDALTEYLDTIYLDKFCPDSIESQFPLIERGQEILTITPMESRDRIWNYIDNIKSLKTRKGYELEFGKATYIDLTLTSGEIVELGANDLVYLLNDNGKTIETLCRAKIVRYNKEKADILRKYVLKEYTKEEMIEALNDMYSKEISNKELIIIND